MNLAGFARLFCSPDEVIPHRFQPVGRVNLLVFNRRLLVAGPRGITGSRSHQLNARGLFQEDGVKSRGFDAFTYHRGAVVFHQQATAFAEGFGHLDPQFGCAN